MSRKIKHKWESLTVRSILTMSAVSAVIMSCSRGDSSSPVAGGYSATAASGVVGGVDKGVQGAGTSMGKTGAGGNAIAKVQHDLFDVIIPKAYAAGGGVSSVCDMHSYPLQAGTNNRLANTDPSYPAMVFFCKLAYNTGDPDSVQGSYMMVRSIACMLEKAGLTFDGVDHSVTATPDTSCFTSTQLSNMGAPSSMTVTANASQPANFNTHYAAGVKMTVPGFGIFYLAANVTGSKLEFLAMEDQTATTSNKTGAYAASYDYGTGKLLFESRHDRYHAPMTAGGSSCGSSCGWSRHLRLLANMTVDADGNPTGVVDVEGAFASLGKTDDTGTGANAEVDSISGSIASGLKARLWMVNTEASMASASNFTETVNSNCYVASGASGTGCGAGIDFKANASNNAFTQFGTGYGLGYTNPIAWGQGLSSGLSYTTVTFDDVQ